MNKLVYLLTSPILPKNFRRLIMALYRNCKGWHSLVDNNPRQALEIMWRVYMGYNIDWNNCRTLNEKIQWLEVFTDTTLWTEYADKYLVRQHIKELGLGDYLPQLYGVWDKVEDIDYNQLPESFVIKCNHDCGSAIVVTDKTTLNIEETNEKLKKHLNRPWGYKTGEPHYTRIKRKIIAEELIGGKEFFESNQSLVDYKFWCTNGKVQLCLACYNRVVGKSAVYDLYNVKPWSQERGLLAEEYANQLFVDLPEPQHLDEMINISERISSSFPQLRVDLYNVQGKIYFGEMTFTGYSGRMIRFSDSLQLELGEKVTLPAKDS